MNPLWFRFDQRGAVLGQLVNFDISGLALPLPAVYIIFDLIRSRAVNPIRKIVVYTFWFLPFKRFRTDHWGLFVPPWPEQYRTVVFQPVPFRFLFGSLELYRRGVPDRRFQYLVKTGTERGAALSNGSVFALTFRHAAFQKERFVPVLPDRRTVPGCFHPHRFDRNARVWHRRYSAQPIGRACRFRALPVPSGTVDRMDCPPGGPVQRQCISRGDDER